jgi:hypothetical protein
MRREPRAEPERARLLAADALARLCMPTADDAV